MPGVGGSAGVGAPVAADPLFSMPTWHGLISWADAAAAPASQFFNKCTVHDTL